MSRFDLVSLRAAWWTVRAARRARRHLVRGGLDGIILPAVPPLPYEGRRAVGAVLRHRSDTCLVRATVRQAWDAAHGHPRDLVIGVTAPGSGFKAHAWLEGDPPCQSEGFHELTRHPPRSVSARSAE